MLREPNSSENLSRNFTMTSITTKQDTDQNKTSPTKEKAQFELNLKKLDKIVV